MGEDNNVIEEIINSAKDIVKHSMKIADEGVIPQPSDSIKEFKDIRFSEHPVAKAPAVQAVIKFPNGQDVSIIGGGDFNGMPFHYGDGVKTFEAWCRTDGSQPKSYASKEDVMKLIKKVKAYTKGMLKREEL